MIGSDVTSALPKSSLIASSSCLFALASPNWPNSKSGCAAFAAFTASSAGSTRSWTWSSSPAIRNRISAECPSSEICPRLPGL